jgi:hypothetical protein
MDSEVKTIRYKCIKHKRVNALYGTKEGIVKGKHYNCYPNNRWVLHLDDENWLIWVVCDDNMQAILTIPNCEFKTYFIDKHTERKIKIKQILKS